MKQFIICPECGMPILAKVVKGVVSEFEYHFKCEYCECEGFDYEVEIMKAISIRQPWAYLVIKGIKPIENRTWKLPEKYKGKRVLVHSGITSAKNWVEKVKAIPEAWDRLSNKPYDYHYSAIIGSVEIVDCVINHPSIWAEKTPMAYLGKLVVECQPPIYNWVLKNPILFDKPILKVKGKLSFFIPEIPD